MEAQHLIFVRNDRETQLTGLGVTDLQPGDFGLSSCLLESLPGLLPGHFEDFSIQFLIVQNQTPAPFDLDTARKTISILNTPENENMWVSAEELNSFLASPEDHEDLVAVTFFDDDDEDGDLDDEAAEEEEEESSTDNPDGDSDEDSDSDKDDDSDNDTDEEESSENPEEEQGKTSEPATAPDAPEGGESLSSEKSSSKKSNSRRR